MILYREPSIPLLQQCFREQEIVLGLAVGQGSVGWRHVSARPLERHLGRALRPRKGRWPKVGSENHKEEVRLAWDINSGRHRSQDTGAREPV